MINTRLRGHELTLQAAHFMVTNHLVIRNSYTTQLRSLHLGMFNHPETHSTGGGSYCIPLWTICLPTLIPTITQQETTMNGTLRERIDSIFDQLPDEKDIEERHQQLDGLSNDTQHHHLAKFRQQMQSFIKKHCTGSTLFNHGFDYELLIAQNAFADKGDVDDRDRYPTGGRSHHRFDHETLCYRATLSATDRACLQSLLNDYPLDIPGLAEAANEVQACVRMQLTNQLASEIIIWKTCCYLNQQGANTHCIAIRPDTIMNRLLPQSLEAINDEIITILKNAHQHYLTADSLAENSYKLGGDNGRPYPPTSITA